MVLAAQPTNYDSLVVSFDVRFNTAGIDSYIANLHAACDAAEMEGALQVAELARGNVRVDTGSLRDTIDVEKTDQGTSVNAGNTQGGYRGGSVDNDRPAGSPVDYAADQEFSLTGTPSTPFMTPAAEAGWPIVQEIAANKIREISG